MNYLLDTHIFLWWIGDNPKLASSIRKVIADKKNRLFLSAASIWEMMIKSKLNKLDLHENPKEFITQQVDANDIEILDVKKEHSFEVYNLPEIHKDPFDRMLVAQAKVEDLTIITTDPFIKKYDVKVST